MSDQDDLQAEMAGLAPAFIADIEQEIMALIARSEAPALLETHHLKTLALLAAVEELRFNSLRSRVLQAWLRAPAPKPAKAEADLRIILKEEIKRQKARLKAIEDAVRRQVHDQGSAKSPRLIALGLLLREHHKRIWFDEFHRCLFIDFDGRSVLPGPPRVLDEVIENELINWLHTKDERLAYTSDGTLRAAISAMAHRDVRNEPKDGMRRLVWDNVDRLGQLFHKGFGAADTPFNREAGRCWMVSMVARVMEPGCKVDTFPVFQSDEGVRKGQALEIIGGKYYRAASAKMQQKDFLQALIGCMLMELAEMHSLASQHADENKFTITNRNDYFRAPYARQPAKHPRTAVFAGTTNRKNWFRDQGPGRRFDPVYCGVIDLEWLRKEREQLWAQAVHHYDLGIHDPRGCWWNQPPLEHAELIDTAREEIEFSGLISIWLETAPHYDGTNGTTATAGHVIKDGDQQRHVWGTLLETDRIAREALFLSPETTARNNNRQKIGTAMTALGFETDRQRIKGTDKLRRYWTRSRGSTVDITLAEPDDEPAGRADGQFHF